MDVTIPRADAARLCDAAGVVAAWFPAQQRAIDEALAVLLVGGTPSGTHGQAIAAILQQRYERQ